MAAYMTVLINKVHTFDWVADYARHVPALVRSHGGEYLAISRPPPDTIESVEGSGPIPAAIVLFRFPSVAAAKAFMHSPQYAPFRSARQAAADSDFFVFENDDRAPQWAR
jgi:uncharacterized protein (DUF1330 family)